MDDIILIIVVGDQWSFAAHAFMIRIEIAKVAPAVLVNYLASGEKRLGSFDRYIDQIVAAGLAALYPMRIVSRLPIAATLRDEVVS